MPEAWTRQTPEWAAVKENYQRECQRYHRLVVKHPWIQERRRWEMRAQFGYTEEEAFFADYVDACGRDWEVAILRLTRTFWRHTRSDDLRHVGCEA